MKFEIILEEYASITRCDFLDIAIYTEDGDEVSKDICSIDLSISNINHFTGEVKFEGILKINYMSTTFYTLDMLDKKIRCKVNGIKKDYSKQWFENLVNGAIYQELGNHRMAYFNIFSGFEEFVNLVYDELFDTYLEEYNKSIEEMERLLFEFIKIELIEKETNDLFHKEVGSFKNCIDVSKKIDFLKTYFLNIDDNCDESDIEDYFEELYEIYMNEITNKYETIDCVSKIYQQINTVEIENTLKENIRNFAISNNRLREKIKICSEIVDMKKPVDHNNEFRKYYDLLKKLDSIEKCRNAIAHGRKVQNLPIDDLLYFTFTIILSLCLNCDFEDSGWAHYLYN